MLVDDNFVGKASEEDAQPPHKEIASKDCGTHDHRVVKEVNSQGSYYHGTEDDSEPKCKQGIGVLVEEEDDNGSVKESAKQGPNPDSNKEDSYSSIFLSEVAEELPKDE